MVIIRETKEVKGIKTFITKYQSINDLEHDIFSKEVNNLFKGRLLSSITGDKNFTGTNNLQEALRLLKEGWDSGAEKLTEDLKVANLSTHKREVKKAVYDIVGFQASVPRYLQGVPTSMINKRNVQQKAKIITLIKSCSYSAKVGQDMIFADSVRFLRVVQTLESQGYRVNIYSAFHAECEDESIFVQTKIKSANERLNISKMAFALAHPSFLRRILLRYIETEENIKNRNWTRGYGQPSDIDKTNELLEKDTYFIKALIPDIQLKQMFNIDQKVKL